MFLEVHISVCMRARNKSQNVITLLSKTTFARYPLKKYMPFGSVISVIAIREPALPTPPRMRGRTWRFVEVIGP